MLWIVGYYFTTLFGSWILIGWDDNDESADLAIRSIAWCWIALPMCLFCSFGKWLRKITSSKGGSQ